MARRPRHVYCQSCAKDGLSVHMSRIWNARSEAGELLVVHHCPRCWRMVAVPASAQRQCPKCHHVWREPIPYRPAVEPTIRPLEAEESDDG